MADQQEPEPDFAAIVDRELRIADNLQWAEAMWAEILRSLQAEAARMRRKAA